MGQWQQVSWERVYQCCGLPISPYVKPGDPTSGLLPEISSEPYGKPGDGDHRIQAYNFRMHLTKARDKIAFPKPDGYDADRYALLARFLNIEPRPRWTLNYTTKPMTDGPVQMKNGDSNNAGSFLNAPSLRSLPQRLAMKPKSCCRRESIWFCRSH